MKSVTRRVALSATFAAGLFSVAASPAAAAQENYPNRPVTLLVPHAPGGAVDNMARIYAERLSAELKQSVVVENKAGASGMIGAAYAARAQPDGYTLYFNASIHSINPLLYKEKVTFDAVKDFTPVSLLSRGALIFSVNPNVPAKTVPEFVKELKTNPGKYSLATSGFGSAGHLGAAKFLNDNALTDRIPIVLYKGAAPALQDVVGGQVSGMMDPMLSSLPQVRSGNLRPLAITANERSPLLPDVPTMAEAGFPDFNLYSWYGLWAPAKTPAPIVAQLEAASAKIMNEPAMKERLASLGFEAAYKDSAAFSQYITEEMTRYGKIIQDANITVQ